MPLDAKKVSSKLPRDGAIIDLPSNRTSTIEGDLLRELALLLGRLAAQRLVQGLNDKGPKSAPTNREHSRRPRSTKEPVSKLAIHANRFKDSK
jgi:hypothetical protein